MEARLSHAEEEFWDGILELILPIKKSVVYETFKVISDVNLERIKTLFGSILDSKDYKYERRKELFKKFITVVSRNRRLRAEWNELDREIQLEFYYKKRSLERILSKKESTNQAKSFYKLINRSEEVEEQEEVDLTDKEEYDLTGSGEPVYETPIMTPQLYRRIMANEFNRDQVEYIIKKSLHL